jgi:hypothetical protein
MTLPPQPVRLRHHSSYSQDCIASYLSDYNALETRGPLVALMRQVLIAVSLHSPTVIMSSKSSVQVAFD